MLPVQGFQWLSAHPWRPAHVQSSPAPQSAGAGVLQTNTALIKHLQRLQVQALVAARHACRGDTDGGTLIMYTRQMASGAVKWVAKDVDEGVEISHSRSTLYTLLFIDVPFL